MTALCLLWLAAFAGAQRPAVDWVDLPEGSYAMGSEDWPYSSPVHRVHVPAFQLARTLVTVEQFAACVRAGACAEPGVETGCNWKVPGRERHPVNCVTWFQAKAFSEWVGGRLPSEAEWEYAARSGGLDRRYPWGDAKATCARAVISQDGNGCGRGSTWPVCSKPKGNTDQGLCDMAGELWEWMADWYKGSYEGAPADGSARLDAAGGTRAYRGGSWINAGARARSASRRSFDPNDRGDHLGFRPARSRP